MKRRELLYLGALLAAQALIASRFFARAAGDLFPDGFDQVDYLVRLAELRAPDSARSLLDGGFPQGWLMHLVAWPLAMLGVPPALAMQAPLLLLEVFLWTTLRARLGAPGAWLGLALFLTARTHTHAWGGPIDFRPDYLAMICFGAIPIAALRTELLTRRAASCLLGALAGLAVHARTFAALYLVLGFTPVLLACALGARELRARRLLNLGIAAGVATLVALPFVLVNRDAIWHYYVENHLSTAEGSARRMGGWSYLEQLRYYALSLQRKHLGVTLLVLAGAALLVVLAGARVRLAPLRGALLPLCFLAPLLALALGPQRSHIVASVCVVPAVLVLVCAIVPFATTRWQRTALLGLAVLGLAAHPWLVSRAAGSIAERRATASHLEATAALRRIALTLPLARESTVATLDVHEALSAPLLRLMRWRATGRLGAQVHGSVGHRIYAIPERELWPLVAAADLVLVPETIPGEVVALDAQGQLRSAQRELVPRLVHERREASELAFSIDGRRVRVFVPR